MFVGWTGLLWWSCCIFSLQKNNLGAELPGCHFRLDLTLQDETVHYLPSNFSHTKIARLSSEREFHFLAFLEGSPSTNIWLYLSPITVPEHGCHQLWAELTTFGDYAWPTTCSIFHLLWRFEPDCPWVLLSRRMPSMMLGMVIIPVESKNRQPHQLFMAFNELNHNNKDISEMTSEKSRQHSTPQHNWSNSLYAYLQGIEKRRGRGAKE